MKTWFALSIRFYVVLAITAIFRSIVTLNATVYVDNSTALQEQISSCINECSITVSSNITFPTPSYPLGISKGTRVNITGLSDNIHIISGCAMFTVNESAALRLENLLLSCEHVYDVNGNDMSELVSMITLNDEASLTVVNSTMSGGGAIQGSAIMAYDSEVEIRNCQFDSNYAILFKDLLHSGTGGAISLHNSTMTVSVSNFTGKILKYI